jgi:hypothetical protein
VKLLSLMILFFVETGHAQLSLRNTLYVEQSRPLQLSAQYSATTDLLNDASPRMYEHDISLNMTYNFKPELRFGALFDVSYFSLNNQIVETQKGYGRAQPSVNLFTSYRLETSFFNSHNVGLSYYLPLDEFSRMEGYKGLPSVSTTFVKNLWTNYASLIQSFRASYLLNSFDKSAIGLPNRTYAVSASPILNISISKQISLLLGFGIRWGKFTDGNTDYSYNNSQTVSYARENVSLFFRHTNGGYTEDGKLYLWYIDKNRNYVDAGMSYDF